MLVIDHLADIAAGYDALLVDLWGCVHNGVTAYPEAVAALRAYRAGGGTVCLLTNSPRPRAGVEAQLVEMNVPRAAWDTIATSGDSARAAMFMGAVGTKVWLVGGAQDMPFFEPMHLFPDAPAIDLVPLAEAEGIVCTSPFDTLADPSAMRPQFLLAKQRGLKLLCANPDIVVDRGDRREWCAGALARLYTEMGGESLYFGKPHPPIYDLATRRLAEIGKAPPVARILAIGDGLHTDIEGAQGEDIDTLFITGGLAAAETGTGDRGGPDPGRLAEFLNGTGTSPTFAIGRLR